MMDILLGLVFDVFVIATLYSISVWQDVDFALLVLVAIYAKIKRS